MPLHKKLTITQIIIILIIINVVSIIVFSIVKITQLYIPFHHVEYLQNSLEEKYQTKFIYVGDKEADDFSDNKIYYFSPKDNSEIMIGTSTWVSWNRGQIATIIPFDPHRVDHDDFQAAVIDYTIKEMNMESLLLDSTNKDTVVDSIYSLQSKIIERLQFYHINNHYHPGISTEIKILYQNREYNINFDSHNKTDIREKLQTQVIEGMILPW